MFAGRCELRLVGLAKNQAALSRVAVAVLVLGMAEDQGLLAWAFSHAHVSTWLLVLSWILSGQGRARYVSAQKTTFLSHRHTKSVSIEAGNRSHPDSSPLIFISI